ncbi:MAG TPA: hypothetical protein VK487_03780 [Candidatus Bathyarchaeia archaeon]|nr:hypothetical protein [Candidatus Bathyarchaeia archaeon]
MKAERLIVGKGRTIGDERSGEWTREYYELQVLIEDPSELEVTKANLTGLIDGWFSASRPTVTASRPLVQSNLGDLDKLPWKTYKQKALCGPDEAGWIFRSEKGAEALADLIEKQSKEVVVQIGPHKFECRFSGDQKQFIGRAPIKGGI